MPASMTALCSRRIQLIVRASIAGDAVANGDGEANDALMPGPCGRASIATLAHGRLDAAGSDRWPAIGGAGVWPEAPIRGCESTVLE